MVRVPEAANVTCCCFGGPKMDTLYVTSATAFVPEGRQEVHGGALFAVKGLGFAGIPETPFFAGGTEADRAPFAAAFPFALAFGWRLAFGFGGATGLDLLSTGFSRPCAASFKLPSCSISALSKAA